MRISFVCDPYGLNSIASKIGNRMRIGMEEIKIGRYILPCRKV